MSKKGKFTVDIKSTIKDYLKEVITPLENLLVSVDDRGFLYEIDRYEALLLLEYNPRPVPILNILKLIALGEDTKLSDGYIDAARQFLNIRSELKKDLPEVDTLLRYVKRVKEALKKM
ncbi:hypothetical protein ACFLZK_00215 [Patescibacteria group bacterium]